MATEMLISKVHMGGKVRPRLKNIRQLDPDYGGLHRKSCTRQGKGPTVE